jgi:DNA recombination protein RmuC
LLNSLQMGFRTLAIQKRSSEVWKKLAEVKTEFGKFGEALSAVKEKIEQASRKMEDVDVRSRVITKKLRDVEELPSNPQPMLRNLLQGENDDSVAD